MTDLIIWPDTATDPALMGAKGANLATLAGLGFDVPEFFAIPERAFANSNDDLNHALRGALRKLGKGPYAVRSSGHDEDGAQNSHAGQFDTVLNVGATKVMAAALQVRASGSGKAVTTYRKLHALKGADALAVLVQRMVPANSAGVAFSADPVSGRRDVVVISATAGLGEALVSGDVDGETWRIEIGGAFNPPQNAAVLTNDQARQIADLANRCEKEFAHPQDIEWAFDAQKLWLLQSRAITTPLQPAANPDDAMVVFDNSNIVESYPGLVSPLTYSFASYSYDRVYRAFVGLLGLPKSRIAANAAIFANLLGRIDGRVYYNLGNWYRALALLPGFTLNRGYMETMMGVSNPLPLELTDTLAPPPPSLGQKIQDAGRLGVVAVGLTWQAIILSRTKRRFMARLNKGLTAGPDLAAADLTQLARSYRMIEADLLDRWDAPLVNDFLCMLGFGASRALLEKWTGDAGLAFHNDIMIGQGDIISAEPAQRIARIANMIRQNAIVEEFAQRGLETLSDYPQIQAEIDSYLAKFGDRCTQELKLESIPLSDDPALLVAAISAASKREPAATKDREPPDWAGLFPGKPVRKTVARWLSNWARARVRDRENLRFERTRIFGHARRVFLAMGREMTALGHIDAPRDIFHLTVSEILGSVEGAALSPNLAEIIAQRKSEMAVWTDQPDPPERIIMHGATIGAARQEPQTGKPTPPTGDDRQGTGCSAGTVQATAQVIIDPNTQSLDAGQVLVARSTDPGWIAVFSNASAIVVERGSLLSHSAIVARELGIPCVVGISDATHWIQSGWRVEVNGTTGEVRRIND